MKRQELSVNQLISFLTKEYPSLVVDMMNSDHNYDLEHLSPYHKEGTVYTHLMMVMNEADRRGISFLGRVACLVHDLGKPMSRFVKHEEKKVSFYGHEGSSCFLMISMLQKLGLTDEEIQDLVVVVSKHQYLYQFGRDHKEMNEKDQKRILGYFKNNKRAFEILLELGECDNEGRISDFKDSDLMSLFKPLLPKIESKDTFDPKKKDFKLLIGPQASGKSTLVQSFTNYTVISRDQFVLEVAQKEYKDLTIDDWFNPKVDELFNQRVKLAIKNEENIVIDKMNLSSKSQRSIISSLSSSKYNKSAIVIMKDYEDLKNDLKKRSDLTGKKIEIQVLNQSILSFSAPMYNLFDKIEYKILKKDDYE